jgi:hypothetical protein
MRNGMPWQFTFSRAALRVRQRTSADSEPRRPCLGPTRIGRWLTADCPPGVPSESNRGRWKGVQCQGWSLLPPPICALLCPLRLHPSQVPRLCWVTSTLGVRTAGHVRCTLRSRAVGSQLARCRTMWLLQDKCLAIFFLPPMQTACLFLVKLS